MHRERKKYRLVIDYRRLNVMTIPDKYPIPNIKDIHTYLTKGKWFSGIGFKRVFHQIPLKESDMKNTAFSMNNG